LFLCPEDFFSIKKVFSGEKIFVGFDTEKYDLGRGLASLSD